MSKEFSMTHLKPAQVKLAPEHSDIVAPNYSIGLLPAVSEDALIQNYQSTDGAMDPYKLIVSGEVTSVIFITKHGEAQKPGGPILTKTGFSMIDWQNNGGEELPAVLEINKYSNN